MNTDLTVNYRMSLADYRELCRLQMRQTRFGRLPRWLLPTVLGALLVWGFMVGHSDALAPLGIVFVLVIAWRLFGNVLWIKRCFRIQKLGKHEIALKLTEAGVSYQTENSQFSTDWSEVAGFDESDSHFVLWFNRMNGLVIPKRAFPDVEAGRLFAEFASEHLPAGKV